MRGVPGAVAPAQLQIEPEQIPPALAVSETGEVNSGRGTVIDTFCASDGPPLVSVATRVRLVPAVTGSGASVSVIDRLALASTVVVAVALLLAAVGSVPVPAAAAVALSTVPLATAAPTRAITDTVRGVPTAVAPGQVQATVPFAPTAGVVQFAPALGVDET